MCKLNVDERGANVLAEAASDGTSALRGRAETAHYTREPDYLNMKWA